MCGIFGIAVNRNAPDTNRQIKSTLLDLALLSETRGKDSSGFAFRNDIDRAINVIRSPMPISSLIKEQVFADELDANLKNACGRGKEHTKDIFSVIGHSRLVTNGTQLNDENNQPVVKDGLVGVHNGIIINVDELWNKIPAYQRKYEIDTEIMLSLFRHFDETCKSSSVSISRTLKEITGTVATAFFIDNKSEMVLATNNGSLYVLSNFKDILIFASEKHILNILMRRHKETISDCTLLHVKSNTGYSVNLADFQVRHFNILDETVADDSAGIKEKSSLNIQSVGSSRHDKSLLVDFNDIMTSPKATREAKMLEFSIDEISKLRRCTRCLLPETFPFIHYDSEGVCSYCNNYRLKNQPRPLDDLLQLVEPYRSTNGSCDCIVPYSGGRDSTFVLHMIKKVLGLNPITFTYDWGMVTDLARRNIARTCGKLGVENIIVAADIFKKRSNIKKNISAWLRKPILGMVPLFMAGDKYFFYYTNQLKKQTGIQLNIWGINNLENTDFKSGFAGVKPVFDKERIYSLSTSGKLSFFAFIGKNFFLNPHYFNLSNLDSIGSFLSRYMFPQKDYYSFFDYYQWNEKEIENLIINEYDWETAIDTKSTWRIGDGTAGFYNYVYFTVAGFSEIDTFRSNQIREGLLSREKGLKLIEEENRPRYENIKWYLEIVGLDFADTIKQINAIPKLYRK